MNTTSSHNCKNLPYDDNLPITVFLILIACAISTALIFTLTRNKLRDFINREMSPQYLSNLSFLLSSCVSMFLYNFGFNFVYTRFFITFSLYENYKTTDDYFSELFVINRYANLFLSLCIIISFTSYIAYYKSKKSYYYFGLILLTATVSSSLPLESSIVYQFAFGGFQDCECKDDTETNCTYGNNSYKVALNVISGMFILGVCLLYIQVIVDYVKSRRRQEMVLPIMTQSTSTNYASMGQS